jgi:transcriptional regulator with XRE-family HTH domain
MSELREIRKQRGLTLEAVGYLAGIDAATISRIERSEVTPKPETIVAIAKALGVAVSRIAPKARAAP